MFTIHNFIYSKSFFLICHSLDNLVPPHCNGHCNTPPRSLLMKKYINEVSPVAEC